MMRSPSFAIWIRAGVPALLFALWAAPAARAQVSNPHIRIGDADGFGFGVGAGLYSASNTPANKDGFGILLPGDQLPDLDRDGRCWLNVGSGVGDNFDNRDEDEINGTAIYTSGFEDLNTVGSEFTDISLSTSFDQYLNAAVFPASPSNQKPNQPGLRFDFLADPTVVVEGEVVYFNLVFGDYDVLPAELILTRLDGSYFVEALQTQSGNQDGLIQAAYLELPFSDVFTWDDARGQWRGYLEVDFDAPNEPYTAFDYAELSTAQIDLEAISPETDPLPVSLEGDDCAMAYDEHGVPVNATSNTALVNDADFWTRLSENLPEAADLRNTRGALVSQSAPQSITVDEEAEVFVTFLQGDAAAAHSLGYFLYSGALPASQYDVDNRVVLPNTEFAGGGVSLTGLSAGDRTSLGTIPAGTTVGFFLAIEGWDPDTCVKPSLLPASVIYSVQNWNQASDVSLLQHSVLLYDPQRNLAVLGFETESRGLPSSDHDFNDVVVAVTWTPETAVDTGDLPGLVDMDDVDGDGVLNAQDAYPDDPERAFHSYYPSQSGQATLAFEDQWPNLGDYDMNDLVVDYHYRYVLDAQNRLKDVEGTYVLRARGAGLRNGFGISFDDISSVSVSDATITVDTGASQPLTPEAGQAHLVWILTDDVKTLTVPPLGCDFFNVEDGCDTAAAVTLRVRFTFNSPRDPGTIGSPPYNPFLFRTDDRGHEIHLPGRAPTSLADLSLFDTQHDDSTAQGMYYRSEDGLPWALDVSVRWRYPLEREDVALSYTRFGQWAQSGGSLFPDWHSRDFTAHRIFNRE